MNLLFLPKIGAWCWLSRSWAAKGCFVVLCVDSRGDGKIRRKPFMVGNLTFLYHYSILF